MTNRISCQVDVRALTSAIRRATLPASLAFPIFDAVGLDRLEREQLRVVGFDAPHPARLPRRNKGHASGSSREGRASGRRR
jgi:hypothetical protein